LEGPGVVETCAFFEPNKVAVVEGDLEAGDLEEGGREDKKGLLGLADTERGMDRRRIGGGTKGEKVGLSESPVERDMSARCIIHCARGHRKREGKYNER